MVCRSGAFAAIAQQAPIPATRDIDITPDATAENLTRLSQALTELGARIRTETAPEGLPFGHDVIRFKEGELAAPVPGQHPARRAAVPGLRG